MGDPLYMGWSNAVYLIAEMIQFFLRWIVRRPLQDRMRLPVSALILDPAIAVSIFFTLKDKAL